MTEYEVNEYLPKVAPLTIEALDDRDTQTELTIQTISGETSETLLPRQGKPEGIGDVVGRTTVAFGSVGVVESEAGLHGPVNVYQDGRVELRFNVE